MTSESRQVVVPKQVLIPFILLTSLFALWGIANNMTDVLLATFKRIMSMTDFQTSWIHVAFLVPLICFLVVLYYGLTTHKLQAAE